MLERYKEAQQKLTEALESKPAYAPAYIALSDLFEQQGNILKAVETLREGIAKNPASGALKKKLQRVEARASGSTENP